MKGRATWRDPTLGGPRSRAAQSGLRCFEAGTGEPIVLLLRPPDREDGNPQPLRATPFPQLTRKDLLGGLIHEYERAA
jgi:hypothetical protein